MAAGGPNRAVTALAGRFLAGDGGAFDSLVRLFWEPVMRFVWKRVPAEDAKDLTQEVFAAVYRAARRGGGPKEGDAAFAAFGGSLEDFIRLFVTIKQTTQLSDSMIGTAIKIISSRVFRPETLRFLQDNHVQVIDELTGKYVGFEQVLRQVAARWDNLSAPRRAEFARQLGGFRQIDKVLAAVRNIDLG